MIIKFITFLSSEKNIYSLHDNLRPQGLGRLINFVFSIGFIIGLIFSISVWLISLL